MFSYGFYAKVLRVVDGDTLELEVDQGFKHQQTLTARLYGIDTPEKFGVKKGSDEYIKGVAATKFVEDWLRNNAPDNKVWIESHKETFKQGSLRRWLVQIYALKGEQLNELLVKEGHAKVYKRGK